MKNSALIRVFSIVLAILSVVLIVTGSLGIKKAYEDKSLNERRLKKLVTAADSYEELSAKLKGKDSYSKALTKFEKHEKDYNKSAAEHKTDLAVYTATQGGIREAREMIYANRKAAYDQVDGSRDSAIAQVLPAVVEGARQIAVATFLETEQGVELQSKLDNAKASVDSLQSAYDDAKTEEEKLIIKPQLDTAIQGLQAVQTMYDSTIGMVRASITEDTPGIKEEAEAQTDKYLTEARNKVDEMLQPAFDAIWREEKKLEEDAAELETEKTDLEKDYKKLNDEKKALDELKADEQRMTSSKVTLTNNENIKSAVDGGEDLITASRNEITRFTDSMHHDFKYRVIACGLMLFAALMGFVDIPAAFEKTKSKFLLIAPVVLFVLCCGGAEGISLWLGRGNMYSAISAGAFGIIQLLLMIF